MGFLTEIINRAKELAFYISSNLKALFVRAAFAIHGCITVWRVTDIHSDPLYYLLAVPIALLLVELVVTAKFTENGEWKWFCPSVFLYLASIVPGIWLLQLDMYDARLQYRNKNNLEECGELLNTNSTGLRDIKGVSIPIALSAEQWALALEQILFFLLIMGRWLLPKGQLTRDQLSQLLLVYVGIAADSLEFSLETLKIQQVLCHYFLICLILGIWSWSLLQFTLVLTTVAAPKKPRGAIIERTKKVLGCCCENEIWALIITMFLQDAPYLAMRLFLMVHFRVINQMMLFFTIKNTILVILQIYRLAILCCFPEQQVEPFDNGSRDINDADLQEQGQFNEVAMDTVTVDEEFERIDHLDRSR